MPSPLVGAWELVSDTERGLIIHTETHYGVVMERQQRRRGLAGPYSVEGNRLHAIRLVDTDPAGETSMTFEFQRDGDTLTTKLLAAGTMVPAGHTDTFRKMADLAMTSPFTGVWQLVSETDKAINVRTDTHSRLSRFTPLLSLVPWGTGVYGIFTVILDSLDSAGISG